MMERKCRIKMKLCSIKEVSG